MTTPILAMSDVAVSAIISGIFSFLTALLAAYVAIKVKTLTIQGTEAAQKVETVREAAVITATKVEAVAQTVDKNRSLTATKLDEIALVGQQTHTLVNSAMSLQLRLNMVLSQRVASITKDLVAELERGTASTEHSPIVTSAAFKS